jgi:hypothetical protein
MAIVVRGRTGQPYNDRVACLRGPSRSVRLPPFLSSTGRQLSRTEAGPGNQGGEPGLVVPAFGKMPAEASYWNQEAKPELDTKRVES